MIRDAHDDTTTARSARAGLPEAPAGATAPDSPLAPGLAAEQPPPIDAVETVIAGFIGWLAGHNLGPGQRRHYHLHAERWLRWEASRPATALDRTQWGYYDRLRRHGVSDAELHQVRAALLLLGRHLLTATLPDRARATPTPEPMVISGGHGGESQRLPSQRATTGAALSGAGSRAAQETSASSTHLASSDPRRRGLSPPTHP